MIVATPINAKTEAAEITYRKICCSGGGVDEGVD
jgi:hypothetical protein